MIFILSLLHDAVLKLRVFCIYIRVTLVKQNPVICYRHFARYGYTTPADQPSIEDGVGRPSETDADEKLIFQWIKNAMNSSGGD